MADDEVQLEVRNVGKSFNKQFLEELSTSIGLSNDVCDALLKAGWTLETAINEPATWTQSVSKLKI